MANAIAIDPATVSTITTIRTVLSDDADVCGILDPVVAVDSLVALNLAVALDPAI